MSDLYPVSATYVTENELARLLGAASSTVSRWRRQGRLPASIKVGGTRYYLKSDIANLLRRGTAQ